MNQLTDEAPIACTLGSVELEMRAGRWKKLYDRAGIERVETEDGLRVHFARDPTLERELEDLVAAENECCRWADWAIAADERALTLEIRSSREGVEVIHGWFLARSGRPAQSPQASRAG